MHAGEPVVEDPAHHPDELVTLLCDQADSPVPRLCVVSDRLPIRPGKGLLLVEERAQLKG
jgi:hypothetical protein